MLNDQKCLLYPGIVQLVKEWVYDFDQNMQEIWYVRRGTSDGTIWEVPVRKLKDATISLGKLHYTFIWKGERPYGTVINEK